jgi:hypothetical protein
MFRNSSRKCFVHTKAFVVSVLNAKIFTMLSELENTSEIVRVHDGGGSAIVLAGYIEPKKLYQK